MNKARRGRLAAVTSRLAEIQEELRALCEEEQEAYVSAFDGMGDMEIIEL